MTSFLTTVQQFLLFSGAVLLIGCLAWRLFVAPDVHRVIGDGAAGVLGAAEERTARLALWSALAVVVAWLMRGIVQLMAFRDPFVPIREDIDLLLFQTVWGSVWMAQGGIVVVLALTVLAARRASTVAAAGTGAPGSASPWTVAALLSLALAATLAASGHAMGADSLRGLALTADGLHVVGAGCWIGTLAVILTAGRGTDDEVGTQLVAAQLRRFSPLALVSGGTLVGMGAFLSWTHLHAVSDLWTSGYGRLLLAKVGLAGAAFLLGFVNWRRGLPVLDTEHGSRAVRRRAAGEVALATGVLALTALLVHATKP